MRVETDVRAERVPKLRKMADYPIWAHAFEKFCKAKDPNYWDIYTGAYQPNIKPMIDIPIEEIRTRCAASLSKAPEDVESGEISAWIRVNVTLPNEEFQEWSVKNARVVSYIRMSIAENFETLIVDYDETAANIKEIFTRCYERSTTDSWLFKVHTLMNTRYEPGMQASQFIENFNHALIDVSQCAYRQLPTDIVYAISTNSVMAHGDMFNWTLFQEPDLDSESAVETAMEAFLKHENDR